LKQPNSPLNTKRNMNWAVKSLQIWWEWCNSAVEDRDELCLEIVVASKCTVELLNKWLPVYVIETRNKNGDPYPPKTLYSLLTGILRHMRTENLSYRNFLEKTPSFVEFHRSLDNRFRKLRKEGVGADSKQTATITVEEENLLWSKGVLDSRTLKGLLRTVFFYNGKNFTLRGGQEHRNLQISQLSRLYHPDRHIYTENSSKNRAGGLAQLRLEHKRIPIYSVPSAAMYVCWTCTSVNCQPMQRRRTTFIVSPYNRTAQCMMMHPGIRAFRVVRITCQRWYLRCLQRQA